MRFFSIFMLSLITLIMSETVSATSLCRQLARDKFIENDLNPAIATKETVKDSLTLMADGETFCKTVVKVIKQGKRTPEQTRQFGIEVLREAEADFEKDGDLDELGFKKYIAEIIQESADIAEGKYK
ncbi:hypothetical protein [Xenorhabdus bharatensis]|uniref:hypothetical protein n=1 Tax=Xenorhabdus bharatensis TaxID=3136256 RepID=UPI0030F3F73A